MTTNSVANTRAERRRVWKEVNRKERYEKSGFLDWTTYSPFTLKTVNKYMPHIGKKQRKGN